MPTFEIIEAGAIDTALLHAAFTRAFADYLIGPFDIPLSAWPQFLARQCVDLSLSRAAVGAGEPLAFCFVAPRPECGTWRLGTMGAVPAARGTGAASALLDDFIARAATAGTAGVELECFAQNVRARRLYEGRGFEVIDELHGYQCTAPAEPVARRVSPQVIEPPAAFEWLDQHVANGFMLPLQVTARVLRAASEPLQAWRAGSAQLVFSEAGDGSVRVHSLVDPATAQVDAGELAQALLASHPGRMVRVPQLQRQAVGGLALERAGFQKLPLHQLWMHRRR